MLAEYGAASGQVVNFNKSLVSFSANVVGGAPMVSHLFFADDCFLFFNVNQ